MAIGIINNVTSLVTKRESLNDDCNIFNIIEIKTRAGEKYCTYARVCVILIFSFNYYFNIIYL